MKNIILFTIFCVAFSFQGFSQNNKTQEDAAAIKKMCGCFEVTFNFTETFNYSNDSLYQPSKSKIAKALEWAQVVTDEEKLISIQHLLQVGSPEEPYIIKHWRQDWLYENTDFYLFNGDRNWTFAKKSEAEVKGQWTQKVYQVDDSPRYEGSATWVHVDGKSYWENTTPAPLPRREYTIRSDYNITLRGNRHEITNYGWLHDQDNSKIIREADKEDIVLANEKGYNTYVKVADSKCKAAADWWTKQQGKWATVRGTWSDVFARNTNLSLEDKVDNLLLYKQLFDDELTKKDKIDSLIESYIKK